jgi:hypothetical protein
MSDFGLRALWVGASLLAALALAGCASEGMDGASELKSGIVELPASRGADTRTAAAKPKDAKPTDKVAAADKADAPKAAAQYRPAASGGNAQDEASCTSVDKCANVLRAMVAGSDRKWIGRPASPTVLSNGVRLFAYRALKPKLSCPELAAALTEVETAAQTFSGPIGNLDPEQAGRARTLSVEVGDELAAENARRCSQAKPIGSTTDAVATDKS